MLSLLARRTERLDAEDLCALGLAEVREVYDRRRYEVFRQIARILARPMSASQLDDETLRVFAANLLVAVLQTIGRAMRKRMPVEVYFIDAAWAPHSAEGRPETARSSVLVAMRDVLAACVTARAPDQRDIYHALYGVFAEAFRDIDGVIFPQDRTDDAQDWFSPSPAGLEDAMDGWELEDEDVEIGAGEDDMDVSPEDDMTREEDAL
jgi:hypothetical protein